MYTIACVKSEMVPDLKFKMGVDEDDVEGTGTRETVTLEAMGSINDRTKPRARNATHDIDSTPVRWTTCRYYSPEVGKGRKTRLAAKRSPQWSTIGRSSHRDGLLLSVDAVVVVVEGDGIWWWWFVGERGRRG